MRGRAVTDLPGMRMSFMFLGLLGFLDKGCAFPSCANTFGAWRVKCL